jgi:hypothetical protein
MDASKRPAASNRPIAIAFIEIDAAMRMRRSRRMAMLEKAVEGLLEGGALTGVAVGAGVLLLAPGLLPAVGRALRPAAVGALKTGMTVYRQTSSSLREATEDLLAEARAELEAEGRHAQAARHGSERKRSRTAETSA